MALADFQTALGRLIRVPEDDDPFRSLRLHEDERSCLESLTASHGFHFTVGVQRSWCIGRAKKAGGLTLSILSPELRERLLEAWVNSGGGTTSFFAAEADAFLDFAADRLNDPSHQLTICRFEQATLRAGEGTSVFRAPERIVPMPPRSVLRRGRHAGIVFFHAEPDEIMKATANQRPLPAVSPQAQATMLFAPGIDRLCRQASPGEIALWQRLAAPAQLSELWRERHRSDDIEAMLLAGAIEYGV